MHRTTPRRSSQSPTLARAERDERRALIRIARQRARINTRCRSCGSRTHDGAEQCGECNPYCNCDHHEHSRPARSTRDVVRFVLRTLEREQTGVLPVSLFCEVLAEAFEILAAGGMNTPPDVARRAATWVRLDFERFARQQSEEQGIEADADDLHDADLSEQWDAEAWEWIEGATCRAVEYHDWLDARLLAAAFHGAEAGERAITGVRWDGNADTLEVFEYTSRERRHELVMTNIRAALTRAAEGGL